MIELNRARTMHQRLLHQWLTTVVGSQPARGIPEAVSNHHVLALQRISVTVILANKISTLLNDCRHSSLLHMHPALT